MRRCSLLLAVVAIGLLPTSARSAGPVCALLDPEKDARAALLEAKLLAEPDATWVERASIDKVLAEQKLQALFGAGGVGERVKLGKLLKADVLVLVRRAKDTREPALELVISETGGGLRLLIRGVPISADPDADVAFLLATAREGIKKHATKVTEVVAVPPFVSRDLSTEHDHLKAALARVAEQAAQARPGTLTVELEEAQALAKELALVAPGAPVARPLPIYLLGEYRHTGTGTDRTVSLTLRAERGGKPIGKSVERSVQPDEAAATVRTWAAAALPANGAPVAQPDARAEADQLAARAREFGRIGNWDESLSLFEAAILVDPDRVSLHADALFALSRQLGRTWDSSGVGPRAERSVLLLRRGFEHLETLVTRGGGLATHENRRSLLSEFGGTGPLSVADYMTPKTREFVRSLQKEQREVLFRILPLLIKQGRGEDLRLVGSIVGGQPIQELYEYLEAIILHTQDLPGARERTLRYTQRWHYSFRGLDSPYLRDYLDRLEKTGNAEVKAAVADMRKQIPAVSPWSRKAPDPKQPKPVVWDDGGWDPPLRVALRPLAFTIVGRDTKGPPPTPPVGLLAAGPRADVVWNTKELFLMREPGKLEPVWTAAVNHVVVHSAVFDGRFAWLVVRSAASQKVLALLVIDPMTGKVRDVSAAEGLPKAGENGQTLVLAPLGPRRVAIAGGFGRAWVGVMTFDADAGKASIRVAHEAREAQETSAKDQGGRTTVGFTPTFVFPLRNADGTGPARVLVGRGPPARSEGSINHDVIERPLVVDLERGDATVLDGQVWGSHTPGMFATHDGAVSFFDIEPTTGRLRLARVSTPGRKVLVARDVAIPQDPQIQLLFHEGRIHIVRHEPGSPTVQPGSEWWIADPDGRRVRMIASDLPQVNTVALSSHYGVVVWTSGIVPRPQDGMQAVEFVNLPPADLGREPSLGLTPEDPERIAAKITPVELAKEPDTDKLPSLVGLTAAGPGVDVAWGNNTLYLMTEKGKLRKVWTTDELNAVLTAVCYDGRYVWVAARRSQKPLLLVLDPKTEKVTTVEGLPDPVDDPKDRGQLRTLLLTTLGPGRACVVGWSDRTWVATAAVNADTGKATAKVVHTTSDAPDDANTSQWHSPSVSFTPTFLLAVRGEPGADGVSLWRVLVGRGGPLPGRGKYNTRVVLHPLLVDPDRGTAEVPNYTMLQQPQSEFASLGAAVLFVEKCMSRPGTYQFRRIGFPGVDKQTTAPRVAPGPVVTHDGRIRIVSDLWWVRDGDGKVERKLPHEAHWFRGFAPSSHYGLVTMAELGGGSVSVCTVGFANPPE